MCQCYNSFNMKIEQSIKVNDLKTITPYIFNDFRGEFLETFNKKDYIFYSVDGATIDFIEDDISVSRRGVLRGLHGDEKTWKLIQCLHGEIYYVVVDMR